MDQLDKFKWTIVYTDYRNRFIHYDHIKNSNPEADIIKADIFYGIDDRQYAWRNADKLVRNWLRDNIERIQTNNIAILEWDVFVNQELPNISVSGLFCKEHKIYGVHEWNWFKEIFQLGEYKTYAAGIVPLGVMFADQKCVQTIISPEFDDLYEKDIFCELRIGTILRSKNIEVTEYSMPNVFWDGYYQPINQKSIYHPMKLAVSFKN